MIEISSDQTFSSTNPLLIIIGGTTQAYACDGLAPPTEPCAGDQPATLHINLLTSSNNFNSWKGNANNDARAQVVYQPLHDAAIAHQLHSNWATGPQLDYGNEYFAAHLHDPDRTNNFPHSRDAANQMKNIIEKAVQYAYEANLPKKKPAWGFTNVTSGLDTDHAKFLADFTRSVASAVILRYKHSTVSILSHSRGCIIHSQLLAKGPLPVQVTHSTFLDPVSKSTDITDTIVRINIYKLLNNGNSGTKHLFILKAKTNNNLKGLTAKSVGAGTYKSALTDLTWPQENSMNHAMVMADSMHENMLSSNLHGMLRGSLTQPPTFDKNTESTYPNPSYYADDVIRFIFGDTRRDDLLIPYLKKHLNFLLRVWTWVQTVYEPPSTSRQKIARKYEKETTNSTGT